MSAGINTVNTNCNQGSVFGSMTLTVLSLQLSPFSTDLWTVLPVSMVIQSLPLTLIVCHPVLLPGFTSTSVCLSHFQLQHIYMYVPLLQEIHELLLSLQFLLLYNQEIESKRPPFKVCLVAIPVTRADNYRHERKCNTKNLYIYLSLYI